MVHSRAMEGKDLLRLLLDKRGMSVNALADALRIRSLQSQLQRYLAGRTRSPRPDTLEPVAKFFGIGVEAFYQPAIAERIAAALTQPPTQHRVAESETNAWPAQKPASSPLPMRPTPSVRECVIQLGEQLKGYDESARRLVALLLSDLAMHPESAAVVATRLSALLDSEGNAGAARSTSSL